MLEGKLSVKNTEICRGFELRFNGECELTLSFKISTLFHDIFYNFHGYFMKFSYVIFKKT